MNDLQPRVFQLLEPPVLLRAMYKLAVQCDLAVKCTLHICGQVPDFVESYVVGKIDLSPANLIKFQAQLASNPLRTESNALSDSSFLRLSCTSAFLTFVSPQASDSLLRAVKGGTLSSLCLVESLRHPSGQEGPTE